VVRRDDGIELSFHRAHEHRVGRIRSRYPGLASRWGKHVFVLLAEPAAIATVRVQRAQRDARLRDRKPVRQTFAGDSRRSHNAFPRHRGGHVAQCEVGGRQHHAQRVGAGSVGVGRCQHHRHLAAGQRAEHLGVSRIIEPAGEQC